MPSSGFSAREPLADRGQDRHVAVGPLDPRLTCVREGQVGNVVVLGGSRHRLLPFSSNRRQHAKALQKGTSEGAASAAPRAAKYTGCADARCHGDLCAGQRRLQPLDRLHRRGVDARAARRGRPTRGRPAARATAAARPGSSPALEAQRPGRLLLDQRGGQLDALPHARVLVDVLQEDRREAARASAASCQPTISLWSASGSSAANAGSFAFSLSWRLPAGRDGAGRTGAVDAHAGAVDPLRDPLREAVGVGVRPPLRAPGARARPRPRRSRSARPARHRRASRPRAPTPSCRRRPRAAAARPAAGSPARRPRARPPPAGRRS